MAVCKASDLGTSCLVTAQEAYRLVTNNPQGITQAIDKLKSLEASGSKLIELSNEGKSEFEKKESNFQEQLKDHQRKKAEHEKSKKYLEEEKLRLQTSANQYTTALNNAKEYERRAQSDLRDAERKLARAKETEKTSETASTVGGAVLGFLVGGPIGAVVGGFAGNAVSKAIIEAQDLVDSAERNVRRRRDDIASEQRKVDAANSSLRSTQNEIHARYRDINECQRMIDDIHNQIGAIKDSIAFAMNAIHLWEQFTMACQNVTEQTDRLKQVIALAESKKQYRILKANGTITKVNSFLEGWQEISNQGILAINDK